MSDRVTPRSLSESDSKFKFKMFYSFSLGEKEKNKIKKKAKGNLKTSCLTSYKIKSTGDVYMFGCQLITEDGSAYRPM